MFKWIGKLLTKNYTKIPLFTVTFDLTKYNNYGAKGSCEVKLHPELKDKHIQRILNNLIDYIRENYDMEKISKL
jgi:hypothetical protein